MIDWIWNVKKLSWIIMINCPIVSWLEWTLFEKKDALSLQNIDMSYLQLLKIKPFYISKYNININGQINYCTQCYILNDQWFSVQPLSLHVFVYWDSRPGKYFTLFLYIVQSISTYSLYKFYRVLYPLQGSEMQHSTLCSDILCHPEKEGLSFET